MVIYSFPLSFSITTTFVLSALNLYFFLPYIACDLHLGPLLC